MTLMKACVVNKDATGVEVVQMPKPTVGHGDVLVQVEFCGVCHTDLHVAEGDYGKYPGRVLGHEGVGKVVEVGPGVKSLQVGDRVSIAWLFSACGTCEYCNTGRETLCRSVLNAGYSADGGMAEYCVLPADFAVKVPDALDPAQATSITCAGVTTYKGVKVSDVKPGEFLVAFGCGGLGNLTVQYAARVFGARVIAVDISDEKLELAKQVGAEFTVNAKTQNAAEVIKELTNGGAHAAVVTAVSKPAFNAAVESVRAGGTVVCIGLPNDTMDLSIPRIVFDGIRVQGSLVGTRKDLAEAFEFGARGLVVPVVALRPVEDVADVFQEMHDGKILGRMVLDFRK